jgi:hypothetical protein
MNSKARRIALALIAPLLVTWFATEIVSTGQPPLPNPVLYLVVAEPVTIGGKDFIRYNYNVLNFDAYPNEMFAAAPLLPPCGKNAKSSRTWVDIYDQSGKRLYGFCALGKNSDLNGIWFALEAGTIPPSWIYIEMTDRQTNTKYKSNLADTTN